MKHQFLKRSTYRDGKLNVWTLFWCGLLLVMLFRVFYFGIDYFNYLDDNNTYGVFYRRNGDIFNGIVKWYRLYTFRPIAFLCDAYITQWFWPVMWLPLLFYTVMHFFTVYLFKKTLNLSGISFSLLGIVILSFTPILLEAVYWIGASTRLVPGMFFSILSCYVCLKFIPYINAGKICPLVIYALLNLISTGFYEQIIVFNFLFALTVFAINFRKFEKRRLFIPAVPFISTFLIGAFYLVFWNHGKVQSRGQIAENGVINNVISTAKGIYNILIKQNMTVNIMGIKGFFHIDINIWQVLILIVVFIFFVFAFWIFSKQDLTDTFLPRFTPLLKIAFGFIFTLVTFAPFFVLENNYIAMRTAYPAIFGIAVFAEGLLALLLKFTGKSFKNFALMLISLIGVLFFVISLTEINNYRLVEKDDDIISANFLHSYTAEMGESPGNNVYVNNNIVLLNTKVLYSPVSRAGYENVTASDWAFLGKVNAKSEGYYFTNIYPVTENGLIAVDHLNSETVLFAVDSHLNFKRVFLLGNELTFANGENYGYFTEENGFYRLNIKKTT
ncbi:MAG: hypothetical protein LBU94_02070 [Clostridiales bacterium]|nr:hypothetical protein [Clostridiales bacterium]